MVNNKNISRKAIAGGPIVVKNLIKNWLHQAISYMDTGELIIRLFIEFMELSFVALLLSYFTGLSIFNYWILLFSFIIVHTYNWITNGLFWALIIFAFPNLNNPGAKKTVDYLNNMRDRLTKSSCITGVAIYGSVSRSKWHKRSDIDIRFLRKKGIICLILSSFITMRERFYAFMYKQPMDLFLADDTDFLLKMREDEIPIMLICRDKRLNLIYTNCTERYMQISDLIAKDISK